MAEPQFDLDVVLSLFDGISCGQEALKKAGISTRIFLASEIEKYPKMITRKNHPLTVQLGDVRNVVADDLPHVNLLMGGSPCTGFSFAGKGLAFDDPRSALFFEFVRLLRECEPDYFLLENVMMKQEFKDIITEHLGVEPVMINSSLVSAQNRKRLYWTNIPGVGQPDDLQINLIDVIENGYVEEEKSATIKNQYYKSSKANFERSGTFHATGVITNRPITQPEDKGILLKDVLEDFVGDKHSELEKHILSGKTVEKITRHNNRIVKEQSNPDKSAAIHAGYYKMGGRDQQYLIDREPKVLIVPEKVRVRKYEVDIPKLQALLKEHRKPMREIAEALNVKKTTVEHWFRTDNCFSIPDADVWFELKEYLNIETNEFDASITEFEIRDGRYDMADRVYNPEYKAPTVVASNVSKVLTHPTYRKLSPVECERLQTLSDNYTEGISNTQRYKALGNGWTVDVIVHILQGLKWQS